MSGIELFKKLDENQNSVPPGVAGWVVNPVEIDDVPIITLALTGSNYSFEYVDSTWENIRHFKGGTAIFTQPSGAVKCGGAPQKIMYLAEDAFRRAGVREKTNVVFAAASPHIFAIE